MNAHGTGGSLRAAIAHAHDLAALIEDVDLDDAAVYLPMHDEREWYHRQYARHYQEFMAQEEGLNDEC